MTLTEEQRRTLSAKMKGNRNSFGKWRAGEKRAAVSSNMVGLIFQAVQALAETDPEMWVLNELAMDRSSYMITSEIAATMMKDQGYGYSSVSKALTGLVNRRLAFRRGPGKYAANMVLVTKKMMEILDSEEGKQDAKSQ